MEVRDLYLDTVKLIERLHRQFLEVIKVELDRLRIEDINNIQSLILFNISKSEMTVGELTNRGYYLGSNVSYNVGKMVQNGYIEQQRSSSDRRSVKIKLTTKGLRLCDVMNELFDMHVESLGDGDLSQAELQTANVTLNKLERYWSGMLGFGVRFTR